MCRQVQACVFHSVAKLDYPQRCVFLPEKIVYYKTTEKRVAKRVEAGDKDKP